MKDKVKKHRRTKEERIKIIEEFTRIDEEFKRSLETNIEYQKVKKELEELLANEPYRTPYWEQEPVKNIVPEWTEDEEDVMHQRDMNIYFRDDGEWI